MRQLSRCNPNCKFDLAKTMRRAWKNGFIGLIVVGILMVIGNGSVERGFDSVSSVLCPKAEAGYGFMDSLTTLGISTGIGATLGLSTMPFYEFPEDHFKNILIGAGAGLIVGVGVAAYLLVSGSDSDEINPEELLQPQKKIVPQDGAKEGQKTSLRAPRQYLRSSRQALLASVPAPMAMSRSRFARYAANEWIVSMPVLQLRF